MNTAAKRTEDRKVRISFRLAIAVDLTMAWASSPAHKTPPSVNKMLDALESFHEQLIITEANERSVPVPSRGDH